MMRRADYRDEAGLSLVEILVTMVILGVVLSALTAGAISMNRASYATDLGTRNQNEARTAIAVLSRDIRAASPVRPSTQPAFLVARPDEANFTANLDDGTRPRLVRLFIDGDSRLVEDATPADPASDPATGLTWDTDNDAVIRFIAAFVVNDASRPLFRYLDLNGAELPYSTTACAGPAGNVAPPCLTESDLRRVATVELSLTVDSDPNARVQPFTVTQRVRLPNAT